jgi:hypothetical protein
MYELCAETPGLPFSMKSRDSPYYLIRRVTAAHINYCGESPLTMGGESFFKKLKDSPCLKGTVKQNINCTKSRQN